MNRRVVLIFVLLSGLDIGLNGCGRPPPPLKGQSNSNLTFYGLVVDQDGNPLRGVKFTIEIEAIPKDWTIETRDKPHQFSTMTATTGANGRFAINIVGHILKIKNIEQPGYSHFYDLALGRTHAIDNMFYQLNAMGDPWYKSDLNNPAVYVFVKDGIQEITTLPSRGGYNSVNGSSWKMNNPGWPTKPSLKDVVQKKPTTGSTS